VIDAGHGGHDSGCLGSKSKEKDIALKISLKLGAYIEEHFPDVQVIYTRNKDVFVELHERATIANNAKADLFICIHANSACYFNKKLKKEMCNKDTQGAETWVMGLNRSEANLEVSKRENEVVLLEKDYIKQYDGFDPNSPEANIIFSLYQNAFLDQSLKMASYIQQEFVKNGRNNRGVKQAGFLVLYKTTMPSILVETGFLSNLDEERYLNSDKGQTETASAIFQAFKSYKHSVDQAATRAENKSNEKAEEKSTSDSELVFGVQILLASKPLKKDNPQFKGVENALEEQDKGVYKYTVERLSSLDQAIDLQVKMREKGFSDAFIVPYHNKKRISMKEARQLLERMN
jgi:N-acetylmuramoyl-L-alanine amidase